MTVFYQHQGEQDQEQPPLVLQCPPHLFPQELFPNVLLLMINDDPWEEQPQIREGNKPINVKWISNLIEE